MTAKNWLPAGYKVPKPAGDYMKLEDGPNKFRILSAPVLGYEYWNTQGKPVRLHEAPTEIPADIRYDKGAPEKIKHFWAFIVWNYALSRVQILELTQSTIMSSIESLVVNPDWGSPEAYDITVSRKGKDLTTEYTVQPSPHKPVPAEAVAAMSTTKIDLEKLFEGADPVQRSPEQVHDAALDEAFPDSTDGAERVIE